jgi:hypothetical protein
VKRRLLIALTLAAALVALPSVAFGGAARRESNSATFPDSIGEDPAAPDITSLAVSNDDAGLITFRINVSNRPTFTEDMFFLLFLDTDQNAATGNPDFDGADYVIQLVPGEIDLFQWNGSDYVLASSQTSLVYSYATTGPTIRLRAADLGRTKGFRFSAIAVSGVTTDASGNPDYSKIHRDAAPDVGHGMLNYQVLTRLLLSVTAFTTSPKPAKSGRQFAATLAADENDTGGPVRGGTVGCSATVASKRIVAATHVVANGIASCVWRIPATAKGKTLRGTIMLTVQGVKVTRTFSSRIG